jgi:hypothetical protein
MMSALAPAGAFCAQGQPAPPFSSATSSATSARTGAAMRMLRFARPARMYPARHGLPDNFQ